MASTTTSISIPSIFNTLSSAPRTRDHHAAARQLAGIDPKRFLSNLHAAALNRSPQAISQLKADMNELADIFHKLSRAGHDVSAALRDFRMLEHYVSQLASTQKQRSSVQAPAPPTKPQPPSHSYSQSYHTQGGHHRSSSLPTSVPSSYDQARLRTGSGSGSIDKTPRHAPHPLPIPNQRNSRQAPNQAKGFAPGSSSTVSGSANAPIVTSSANHLAKPRRTSASSTSSSSSSSSKKVHWASHATVYTFNLETESEAEGGKLVPPQRPSCVPRVSSSASNDHRPRY